MDFHRWISSVSNGVQRGGSQVSTTAGIVGAAWANPARPNSCRFREPNSSRFRLGAVGGVKSKEQKSVGDEYYYILLYVIICYVDLFWMTMDIDDGY